MTNKIEVPIEVESIGKKCMFLHIQLGKGTLGKRKIRLIQATGKNSLILQVYSLDGKGWDSYIISMDSVTKAFVNAVEKFEK